MIIKPTFLSEKNNDCRYDKPNEDYVICDKETGFFIVADGVTRDPLDKTYPNPSPASRASEIFCTSLYTYWLSIFQKTDIQNAMRQGILEANKMVDGFNKAADIATRERRAGTVAVIASITKSKLSVYFTGDCGCLVIRNDELIRLTKPQTALVSEHRGSFTRSQIKKDITNNIDHPFGFGVFNGDERVKDFIEYTELDLLPGDTILLYSDGCEPVLREAIPMLLKNATVEQIASKAGQAEIEKKLRSDDKSLIKIDCIVNHKDIILREYEVVLNNKEINDYFQESLQISGFIAENKLSHYTDFGCWYGILLNHVLEQNKGISAIAFDGIKEFTDISRIHCTDPARVRFLNYAVVSEARKGVSSFTFDINDTSKSGFDATGPVLPDTPVITVKDLIKQPGIRDFINASYTKLDLEGIDLEIIYDLLECGLKPKVLHFEVLRRTRIKLISFLPYLKSAGYFIMDIPDYEHAFHSIICSENRSVVIGFKPYKLYSS